MGRFKYSDDEMELNKVLKMDLDESESLLRDSELLRSRAEADERIASSMELLRSLGKSSQVADLSSQIKSQSVHRRMDKRPVIEKWDGIVKEAEEYCPEPVILEDFMSEREINQAFSELDEINQEFHAIHQLDLLDYSICVLAGIIAGAVDILLVGIPKKSKSGLKAKPLSDYIRRRFDAKFPEEKIIELEKMAEVPYDANKNIRYRANYSTEVDVEGLSSYYHRLLSLGHDPLLGFVVGVFDIMTGKMTTIDKSGKFVSQIMEGYADRKETNIFAAIAKQFMHLKSDINTEMGLPAPMMGVFNLLQFGSVGKENQTIAQIVQGMYYGGYDFIHFCSMSIPTMLVEVIVRILYCIKRLKEGRTLRDSLPFSTNREKLPKLKTMLFIAHSAATAINVGKIYFEKNPLAINYPQWIAFAKYSYGQLKWALFDKPELREKYVKGIINEQLAEVFDEVDDTFRELSEDHIFVFDGVC